MHTVTYAFAGRGAALGAMDRLVEAGITRRELQLEATDDAHLLAATPADASLRDFAARLMRACGGAEAPARRPPREAVAVQHARQDAADDDWHAYAGRAEKWTEERSERAFAFGEQRSLDRGDRVPQFERARGPGLRDANDDKPGR